MPNNKPTSPVSYNVVAGKKFATIEKGCAAFGLKPEKRGWITLAGARFENATHPDPALHDVTLWFPNTKSKHWNNVYKNSVIIETPKDITKNPAQVKKYTGNYELRITFLKEKKDYHFVGVYDLDIDETNKQKKCVWKRRLKAFSPDLHEIKEYLTNNKQ